MTIERLENYRTVERQIKMYQNDNGVSFLSGVDTSKPAVQSSIKSDSTADMAMRLCEELTEQEYTDLCEEYKILNEYIYGIKDLTVKEMAKLKFIKGYTLEQVAEMVNYDPSTVSRRLHNYVKKN